jgi:hypothetical protein
MNATDFDTRRRWFDDYYEDVAVGRRVAPDYIFGLTCPCGYPTLAQREPCECCLLCEWEMDSSSQGHIDEDQKDKHSGANHCTLAQARHDFENFYDTWIKYSGTIHPLPGTNQDGTMKMQL